MEDQSVSDCIEYDEEIRFAVVLYGGVSLAIYINGVAQELLRMVRATAQLAKGEQLSEVELIYRELGQVLDGRRKAGEASVEVGADKPVRTRFVVDILSGTSAGGINGVALAKALALKSRNLDVLYETWIMQADLHVLLNDEGSELDKYPTGHRTESLLNNERLYHVIFDTLNEMNADERCSAEAKPFADNIDLFVTATDLRGIQAPIRLTNQQIPERIHKTILHFAYADPDLSEMYREPAFAKVLGTASPTNDFERTFDPMLAFAARCTSSFPGAFAPMHFEDIERLLTTQRVRGAQQVPQNLSDAFEAYKHILFHARTRDQKDFETRAFADGGYLDNRPFSYAIDVIQYRYAVRPVKRKLLFIDPFPETEDFASAKRDISFLDNIKLAAMKLPRYEMIRGDIERLNRSNSQLRRVRTLRKRVVKDLRRLEKTIEETSKRPKHFKDSKVTEAQKHYGNAYLAYHHLRVYEVTDFLSRVICGAAGYGADSAEATCIREVLRVWRNHKYHAEAEDNAGSEDKRAPENTFLAEYDLDYRQRRIVYLVERLENNFAPLDDDQNAAKRDPQQEVLSKKEQLKLRRLAEKHLAQLSEMHRVLASPFDSPLTGKLKELESVLTAEERSADNIRMDRVYSEKEKRDLATKIFEENKIRFESLMNDFRGLLQSIFDHHREERKKYNDQLGTDIVLKNFLSFEWYDMMSFSFLAGTDCREGADIEVFRVSPADGTLMPFKARSGVDKLCGYALMDFGAFLDSRWRENDIMWGRLDGSEQIVTALLPDDQDEILRKKYVGKLRDAILKEEFGNRGVRRVDEWFAQELKSMVSPEANAEELAAGGDRLKEAFPALQRVIASEDFTRFVQCFYDKPGVPSPESSLRLAGRALRIFGRMIGDLDQTAAKNKRISARIGHTVQAVGEVAVGLVNFALPQSILECLACHWIKMIALVGLVILGAGLVTGEIFLWSIGTGTIAASLVALTIQKLARRWLLGGRVAWLLKVLAVIVGLVVIVLMIIGGLTAIRTVNEWRLPTWPVSEANAVGDE